MRIRMLLILLALSLCLVSCTSEKSYTYDEITSNLDINRKHFEAAAGILSANPEFRDYLRNEKQLDIAYSMGKLSQKDSIILEYLSDDDLELLKNSIKYIAPACIYYTTLDIYSGTAITHPVESIEFSFNLQDEKYPDPSVCSIFYVPSEEDQAFIAENPYSLYAGTTVRLIPTEYEGWYIFLFY